MIAGIPGALFAVPLAAFVNVVAVYIGDRAWEAGGAAARPTTYLDDGSPPEEGSCVSIPTLAEFEDAAASLDGVITRTPIDQSQHLSERARRARAT